MEHGPNAREVRAAHVRDGMSNTYLLGEKYLNPANYATGNDISDDHSLFAGDDLDPIGWTDELTAQDTRGDANFYRFGSTHAGGFNMAMADGCAFQPRQPQRRPSHPVGQASACQALPPAAPCQ